MEIAGNVALVILWRKEPNWTMPQPGGRERDRNKGKGRKEKHPEKRELGKNFSLKRWFIYRSIGGARTGVLTNSGKGIEVKKTRKT